jgi:hypothetical protein
MQKAEVDEKEILDMYDELYNVIRGHFDGEDST